MNVVSLVMNYLTPDLIAKIASALGLDRALAQKAIGTAVPSLLAGFTGLAGKPEGARQLANSVGNQDSGLLANFAGMLGSAKQGELISGGTSTLNALFGGGALGSLTGAIAKFSGIGEGSAKSLVGLVGPIVLGQLSKEKLSGNLDASGLARLLDGQKKNIAAAIPSGFSDLLRGTTILDALNENKSAVAGHTAATSTRTSAEPAGRTAGSASAGTTISTPTARPSFLSQWPLWLLAALSAALANWYFFGDGKMLRHASVVPQVRSVMVGDVDVGRSAAVTADQLATALRSIRDITSAQAALPRLQESAGALNRLNEITGRMTPDGRRSFGQYFSTFMPVLWPLLSSVQGIPGLPDAVKTTLGAIQTRVDGLAR